MTRTSRSQRIPASSLIFDRMCSAAHYETCRSLALLTGASSAILSAHANFHITQGIVGNSAGLEACPSNYYNCDCLANHNRAAEVVVNGQEVESLPDSFFSVQSGFCGIGQLNFYKQGDGSWDIYQNDGNGSLQGKCYSNRARNIPASSSMTNWFVTVTFVGHSFKAVLLMSLYVGCDVLRTC